MVGGVAVGRTASTTTDEMFVKDSEGGNPGTKKNSAKLTKIMAVILCKEISERSEISLNLTRMC